MIPEETIDRVRDAADIVQIIGEHVPLKRMGTDYRGPCPFHGGKNRNFSVSPKRGLYHCFKCGEKGNVFSFLQKHLGVDWPTALRMVAEKSGIEVREVESRRDAGPDWREPYWEALSAAREFFTATLWDDAGGRDAREYLEGRRITRAVADRFGLGFAPRDPRAFHAHVQKLGFDDERLLEAGLLVRREEDPARPIRSRFRGRLMIPILDPSGRPAGFGGRLIAPGEPKYLNSPDSRIFSKGRLLYNMHEAKHAIRKDERACIVEGYFDVVRLAAAGMESVVAPLGTALTEDQARLLGRYTKNVFLLYDSDEAGMKATFRSGDVLLREGFSVRVVSLPDGEDPDTFVDKHGVERLGAHLTAAVDVFDRKVMELERRGWFAEIHKRRRAIDKLLPTIRAASDPVTRDLYVTRAAEASGVAKDVILTEAAQQDDEGRRARQSPRDGSAPRAPLGDDAPLLDDFAGEPPPIDGGPRFGQRRGGPGDRRRGDRRRGEEWASLAARPRGAQVMGVAAERDLVRAMLHYRDHIELVAERQDPQDFRDGRYRAIFGALLQKGPHASVEELAEALNDDETKAMQELLRDPAAVGDVDKMIEGSLAQLRHRQLREEQDRLDQQMQALKAATGDISSAEFQRLTAEKDAIVKEMKAMPRPGYWKIFGRRGPSR